MLKSNVLVVDDDKEIVDAIEIYLRNEGINVIKAYEGLAALEALMDNEVHLILLDIMMPKLDGLRTTFKIREEKNIPIILVSAKSEDTDKILGLNMGADDYITKPFNPLELVARVKSQLRRYINLGNYGKVEGNKEIEEKGSGLFRELAHNINNIKEGLRESIKNEMKSERMKSELITNVSHDLKTPLTSIINYIDLLKREDLEPETASEYVKILDSKSQRLKTLIEDLFEASKAASGEMKLKIERLDVVQLLKQTLGEYDERLKECSLEVKVNIPNEKIYVNGDGKRLFRVFENLISNITKYSLNNTRVYIDVINNNEEVSIVMKNISLYELNFDAMEITNRFKRGDEARSTEGSGLGLAIAKSIVELHNGEFIIEVDGDLFKSTIKLGCI